MYAPEPDDTTFGSSPNIPPSAAQLVGVLLDTGVRIVGGSIPDSGPGGPNLGGDPTKPGGAHFGGIPNIGSWVLDLLNQMQQVTGNSNIPVMYGPGAGAGIGNKQGITDEIYKQLVLGMHDVGPRFDPSRGKIPNWTNQNDPTIHSDAYAALLNALQMASMVHQNLQGEMQSHDPYRNDPLHYAPLDPGIYGDGKEDAAQVAKTAVVLGAVGATAGALFFPEAFPVSVLGGAAIGIGLGVWVGMRGLDKGIHADPHKGGGFPAPDDWGNGGPRANYWFPDPEGSSGGGPRGFGVMPNPEDSGGGGPRGLWFPDPDSTGGGGPRG